METEPPLKVTPASGILCPELANLNYDKGEIAQLLDC